MFVLFLFLYFYLFNLTVVTGDFDMQGKYGIVSNYSLEYR